MRDREDNRRPADRRSGKTTSSGTAYRSSDGSSATRRGTETSETAPKVVSRKRKRKLNKVKVSIFIFILIVITAIIVGVVLMFKNPNALGEESPIAVFGVQSITVDGLTRYEESEVVQTSGILIGQSVFSVDKKKAANDILAHYPYIEKVEISNPSFNVIKLMITEGEGVYVTEHTKGFVVMDNEGKGLEFLDKGSDRVGSYRLIKANIIDKSELGQAMVEKRAIDTANIVYAREPEKIKSLDVTDFLSVSADWKGQIKIVFGTDYEIDYKAETALKVLETVIQKEGESAKGQLTVFNYSDGGDERYQVVFTRQDILDKANGKNEPNKTDGEETEPTQGGDENPDGEEEQGTEE